MESLKTRIKRLTKRLRLKVIRVPLVPYYIHKKKLLYIVELEQELTDIKGNYNDVIGKLNALEKRTYDLEKHRKAKSDIERYEMAKLMLYQKISPKKRTELQSLINDLQNELIFHRWEEK